MLISQVLWGSIGWSVGELQFATMINAALRVVQAVRLVLLLRRVIKELTELFCLLEREVCELIL